MSILVRSRNGSAPAHRSRQKFADSKSDASSLKTWIDAANEGSTLLQVLYSAFLIYLVVVSALVLSTTHKQLFLDSPIGVSLGQSLQIKTSLFFLFFPLILLYLHFQLLWQMNFVSLKLRKLACETDKGREPLSSQHEIRLRLSNLVLTHAIVDDSYLSKLARLVLTITLGLAPPLLLLYAQIVFLPYHSESITWTHRIVLLADVLLLATVWPRIFSKIKPSIAPVSEPRLHPLSLLWASTIFFSFVVALFPEESLHRLYRVLPNAVVFDPDRLITRFIGTPDCFSSRDGDLPAAKFSPENVANGGALIERKRRVVRCDYPHKVNLLSAYFFGGFFPHSLQLEREMHNEGRPNEVLPLFSGTKTLSEIDMPKLDEALAKMESVVLRDRNFRFANFREASLFKITIINSANDPFSASLGGTNLQGMRCFGCDLRVVLSASRPTLFRGIETYRGNLTLHQASGTVASSILALGSNIQIEIEAQESPQKDQTLSETVLRGSVFRSVLNIRGKNYRIAIEGKYDYSTVLVNGFGLRILGGSSLRATTLTLSEGLRSLTIGEELGEPVDLRFSDLTNLPARQLAGFGIELNTVDLRFSKVRFDIVRAQILNSNISFAAFQPLLTSGLQYIEQPASMATLKATLEKNTLSKNGLTLIEYALGNGSKYHEERKVANFFEPGFCKIENNAVVCAPNQQMTKANSAEFAKQLCQALSTTMHPSFKGELEVDQSAATLFYKAISNGSSSKINDKNRNQFHSSFESCAKRLPMNIERALMAYSKNAFASDLTRIRK